VVLDLNGDLTYAHRDQFKAAVEGLRQKAAGMSSLTWGMSGLWTAPGWACLALASQNFKLAHGKMSMLRPQSYVREILGLANIPKLIPVFDNEDDAIAGMRRPPDGGTRMPHDLPTSSDQAQAPPLSLHRSPRSCSWMTSR